MVFCKSSNLLKESVKSPTLSSFVHPLCCFVRIVAAFTKEKKICNLKTTRSAKIKASSNLSGQLLIQKRISATSEKFIWACHRFLIWGIWLCSLNSDFSRNPEITHFHIWMSQWIIRNCFMSEVAMPFDLSVRTKRGACTIMTAIWSRVSNATYQTFSSPSFFL